MSDTVVCELLSFVTAVETAGEWCTTDRPWLLICFAAVRLLFVRVFCLFVSFFLSFFLLRVFECIFECNGNRSVCKPPVPPPPPPELISANEPCLPLWSRRHIQTCINIRICRKTRQHDVSQRRVKAGIPSVLVASNTKSN